MSKRDNLPRVNKEIKVSKVRLVGENGEMLGIVSIYEALNTADALKLDLVEISPQADPPVCKILDFGKYKYEAKKKAQEAKKKQKIIVVKEIKFRPNIGQNDFDIKMRSIIKFLQDGDKVKICLWFRGREVTHSEIGVQLFDKVIALTEEHAKIEFAPKMEGKQMMMILAPRPSVEVKTVV